MGVAAPAPASGDPQPAVAHTSGSPSSASVVSAASTTGVGASTGDAAVGAPSPSHAPAAAAVVSPAVHFAVALDDVPGLSVGSAVAVIGDWSGWATATPLARSDGGFAVDVALPHGTHAYKFIVDGAWTLARGQATADDGRGNVNHVLTV